MTREEATKWLNTIKDKYIHGGDEDFDNKRREAIDTAIKSLEAWDSILSEIDRMFSVGFMNSTALHMSILYRNLIKEHLLGVGK